MDPDALARFASAYNYVRVAMFVTAALGIAMVVFFYLRGPRG